MNTEICGTCKCGCNWHDDSDAENEELEQELMATEDKIVFEPDEYEEPEVCTYCGLHSKETYCFEIVKDENAGRLLGCTRCGETFYGCELDDDGFCSECH